MLYSVIADEVPGLVTTGVSIMGILGFVLAIFKIFASDRLWKNLNDVLQIELEDCRKGREGQRIAHAHERQEWRDERANLTAEWRAERGQMEQEWRAERIERDTKMAAMEGELLMLRREVQRDWWLGLETRPKPPYDQTTPSDTTEGEPSGSV